jgi:hypothetical protein
MIDVFMDPPVVALLNMSPLVPDRGGGCPGSGNGDADAG